MFNLGEYEKGEYNTKIKVFIQYLYEKYGAYKGNKEFDNEYFLLLNEEDLIESLRYYIDKNNVTAKGTASNYVGYLCKFFDMLSKEYDIKNEIMENTYLRDRFVLKTKEVYSGLRESENKDIASDQDYEKLIEGINKFIAELNIDDAYLEIDEYMSKRSMGKKMNVKIYNRFVSSVVIKLILKFGLNSSTTISLDINSINIEEKVICINDFRLHLGEELTLLFSEYLKLRSHILENVLLKESKLFIKISGDAYIKYKANNVKSKVQENKVGKTNKDYTSFFKIMSDILNTYSLDKFITRRVLEIINGGVDIATVAKLSDNSIERCVQLQSDNNEHDMNRRLEIFFENKQTKVERKIINKKTIDKKEGYLNCPFCGEITKGTSEEWILVQFEGDDNKYLSCSKCGGKSDK